MNYTLQIITKWNAIDSIIFTLEKQTKKMIDIVKDYREEEPDAEVMIEAETKYLKEENEALKVLQFPKKAVKAEKNYICPNTKCGIEISGLLIDQYKIKFCPECGQRIYADKIK